MPSQTIYQVDAFAEEVFKGNPAAVCFLDEWLDDQVMQNIALENNLSETAFVGPSDDEIAHFSLRWFTPTVEVDLCGHATLASASVLMTRLDPSRSNVTFSTKSGYLTVRRAGAGFEMELPTRAPVDVDMPKDLPAFLGANVKAFLRAPNEGMNLALLESAGKVRSVNPDLGYIKGMIGDGLIISAEGDGVDPVDFVSRYFVPQAGIPEDPVTGSAHCVLVPYWAERLGKTELSARQVSSRGGALSCRLEGDCVVLGGNAPLYLEGTIYY